MKISKEVKTALIVLAAIGVLIYGINLLKGKDIFKTHKFLNIIYSKADGLIPASPVLLHGTKIGQVNDAKLLKYGNDYRILVKLIITEKVDIPVGSSAKLMSSDLLGSKAIDISFSNETALTKNNDTLVAAYEDDLKTAVDKRIAPLQKKAENLISSIDSVMIVVQQVLNANVRQDLIASFESIKVTLDHLQHSSENLDVLMKNESSAVTQIMNKIQSITNNLEKNNEKITQVLNNFASISDSLAKSNIKSTIDNTDKAVTQARLLLEDINAGKGTIGKAAKNDSIYNNLNKASEDLDKLLVDLREHPKRYVRFSVFGGKDKAEKKDKKKK